MINCPYLCSCYVSLACIIQFTIIFLVIKKGKKVLLYWKWRTEVLWESEKPLVLDGLHVRSIQISKSHSKEGLLPKLVSLAGHVIIKKDLCSNLLPTLPINQLVSNFVFDCGRNNKSLFGGASGFMGLGRSDLSNQCYIWRIFFLLIKLQLQAHWLWVIIS